MVKQTISRPWVRRAAKVLTIINLLLGLIFFPIVPLLGWLNYGHADWSVAWIPDAILLIWLPVGYFIYWHGGAIIGLITVGMTWRLHQHYQDHYALVMTMLNGTAVLVYFVTRIIFAVLDIHPDIV